jgi:hypothetical protein
MHSCQKNCAEVTGPRRAIVRAKEIAETLSLARKGYESVRILRSIFLVVVVTYLILTRIRQKLLL